MPLTGAGFPNHGYFLIGSKLIASNLMSRKFNFSAPAMSVGAAKRKRTQAVLVLWQDNTVVIGGEAPVVVQSMTNTDTADAIATAIQIKSLAQVGSELVRITVNTPDAAKEVIHISNQLDNMGVDVTLVGDFQYTGNLVLT